MAFGFRTWSELDDVHIVIVALSMTGGLVRDPSLKKGWIDPDYPISIDF